MRERKKQLKEQYLQMKPEMGVYMICSKSAKKCFLEASNDLKSRINSSKFKLTLGNHPNRELQKEWQQLGQANFSFEILKKLDYDKDESKTDYSEELELLRLEWVEKLAQEQWQFYEK